MIDLDAEDEALDKRPQPVEVAISYGEMQTACTTIEMGEGASQCCTFNRWHQQMEMT